MCVAHTHTHKAKLSVVWHTHTLMHSEGGMEGERQCKREGEGVSTERGVGGLWVMSFSHSLSLGYSMGMIMVWRWKMMHLKIIDCVLQLHSKKKKKMSISNLFMKHPVFEKQIVKKRLDFRYSKCIFMPYFLVFVFLVLSVLNVTQFGEDFLDQSTQKLRCE